MRKLLKITLLGYFSALMLTACQEDEIDIFSGKPAINIAVFDRSGNTDTLRRIDFGFMEEDTLTVDFIARLQGIPANVDRKIKIELSGDAVKGTDYELNTEVILPAGAYEVRIPCLLRRDPSLLDATRTLTLTTLPDEVFAEGFTLSAHIRISDGMPREWLNNDMAQYYLGKCSALKYRFFYDMLGFYDLAPYWNELTTFATFLNNKVADYNDHPDKYGNKYGDVPMSDENGRVKYEFVFE